MLVCMGAALVMITNQYITMMFPNTSPARLGAQVISGIGFLGAGTIIVTRYNQVIGLTTAAGLWACACVGLAIGIGFFEGAIITSILILFSITVLHRLEKVIIKKSKTIDVYIELKSDVKVGYLLNEIRALNISVNYADFTKPRYKNNDCLAMVVSLKLPHRKEHIEIIDQLMQMQSIQHAEQV